MLKVASKTQYSVQRLAGTALLGFPGAVVLKFANMTQYSDLQTHGDLICRAMLRSVGIEYI